MTSWRKAAQEGLSGQILEGLAIRDLESLMINLSLFPASSGCAQLHPPPGVGGGVRQSCVRQLTSAIKKSCCPPLFRDEHRLNLLALL